MDQFIDKVVNMTEYHGLADRSAISPLFYHGLCTVSARMVHYSRNDPAPWMSDIDQKWCNPAWFTDSQWSTDGRSEGWWVPGYPSGYPWHLHTWVHPASHSTRPQHHLSVYSHPTVSPR